MKKRKQKKVSHPIPCDLLIDIFSRVPAKSIFRFRCVSKFWRSILGLPYFTELFLTKSLASPRILLVIRVYEELFLFSSLQPQNPADNSTLVATRYKCFPKYFPSGMSPPLNGLVFLHGWARKLRVVCNPVTGESINLPPLKATGAKSCFFGFDPINKQFKVLCATRTRHGYFDTHWVLTLGTGKRLWRSICNTSYSVRGGIYYDSKICINGVLYHGAHSASGSMIACFDFSSEKFSFIKIDKEMSGGTLVNYKGKLGVLGNHYTELVLWVLEEEDAGKHKWSKIICAESPTCLHNKMGTDLDIVGMTGAGEIVFSRKYHNPEPFYIVYYNIERKTFTRVNIQGFEELQSAHLTKSISIFLDYVENMKLL